MSSSVFHLVNRFHWRFLILAAYQTPSSSLPSGHSAGRSSLFFSPTPSHVPHSCHSLVSGHTFHLCLCTCFPADWKSPVVPPGTYNSKFRSEYSWSPGNDCAAALSPQGTHVYFFYGLLYSILYCEQVCILLTFPLCRPGG